MLRRDRVVIHPLDREDENVVALLDVDTITPARDGCEPIQARLRVAIYVEVGEDGHSSGFGFGLTFEQSRLTVTHP